MEKVFNYFRRDVENFRENSSSAYCMENMMKKRILQIIYKPDVSFLT